jgi:hypothetical protein
MAVVMILTYEHVRRRKLTYGSGIDTYTCASARAQRHTCAVTEQIISRTHSVYCANTYAEAYLCRDRTNYI